MLNLSKWTADLYADHHARGHSSLAQTLEHAAILANGFGIAVSTNGSTSAVLFMRPPAACNLGKNR